MRTKHNNGEIECASKSSVGLQDCMEDTSHVIQPWPDKQKSILAKLLDRYAREDRTRLICLTPRSGSPLRNEREPNRIHVECQIEPRAQRLVSSPDIMLHRFLQCRALAACHMLLEIFLKSMSFSAKLIGPSLSVRPAAREGTRLPL
jgi:hypothetical protein